MKATEIVQRLLLNATDLDVVKELTTEDATYVSLNYHNPDLQAVRSVPHNANLIPSHLLKHSSTDSSLD